jgi:segregation and condensation protein A
VAETKPGFEVRLANFTGPFDLLLGLIAKHQLDITEVAIATVTDEFIKYIRRLQKLGEDWALDEASEFLVIAATLLDIKAARLLPAGEVEDAEDIALLEARDLLFARLLQYKAFKQMAGILGRNAAPGGPAVPAAGCTGGTLRGDASRTRLAAHPEQFAELAEAAHAAQGSAPNRSGPGPPSWRL